MTFKLRSIELDNFRKFRSPKVISGLTDGLNIVVEPNEAGKSTILEALRAAFFVRHGTNSHLTRSYQPSGDNVAPIVGVGFELDGAAWHLTKQFLKSASVELTGPDGRIQSDDAEERLQGLFGFQKDGSRGGNDDVRGALGLLWVGQATALEVAPPGEMVRNSVHSALEAEVGTIVGGPVYEAVRSRVVGLWDKLHTPSGRPTGPLATALKAKETSAEVRGEAERRATAFETLLDDLDGQKARKAVLDRDVADPGERELREQLVGDLEIAKGAAQRLATAKAEHNGAQGALERLTDVEQRFVEADMEIASGTKTLNAARVELEGLADELTAARDGEETARQSLAEARTARTVAKKAVDDAREQSAAADRRARHAAAVQRLNLVITDQRLLGELRPKVKRAVTAARLKELDNLERTVTEARAIRDAGVVRVDMDVHDGTALTIDGKVAEPGTVSVAHVLSIGVGEHATLRIQPPTVGGGASAEAALQTASAALDDALAEHDAAGVADVRVRAEEARDAERRIEETEQRIAGRCEADPALGLSAGPDALRAYVANRSAENREGGEDHSVVNVGVLEAALASAEEDEQRALGRHDGARDTLKEVEARHQPSFVANATAESDLTKVREQVANLSERTERAELGERIAEAKKEVAATADAFRTAQTAASAHDRVALERRIASIDKSQAVALASQAELGREIARLEGQIESDGAKGLAGELAKAIEDEQAVALSHERLAREAAVLDLLKRTLEETHAEGSQALLAPVSRHAARHIHKLMPGCNIGFDENLGLTTLTRGGIEESSADLSKGTQEQLAVLTRLAFADMLMERGAPVSLILDDPLVYSDDARLDAMTDILSQAATDMQVILLTCRERAFRHVDGNRISLL